MFQAVKGFKKADLIFVAQELGEDVLPNSTISVVKDLIMNNVEYKRDPNFVQEILVTAITERKAKEAEELEIRRAKEAAKEAEELEIKRAKQADELEIKRAKQAEELEIKRAKEALELEKMKLDKECELKRIEMEQTLELQKMKTNQELELARIQNQERIPIENNLNWNDVVSSKRKFELPRLQFRQFDGDVKEWLPFWSQFEQIDKDPDIPEENKFQYLVQATVPGSRAREVVDSYPPTSANYVKVIESLKDRFGKDDLLVEVYVRELLKLIISVQTKDRFSLTSLYDKLESYMRALETLGVTKDKCASILYPMVESCFPADFLKAWNRANSATKVTNAQDRLNNLMQFLRTEVEGEERISLAVAGFGLVRKEEERIIHKKKVYSQSSKHLPTAAALLSSTKQDFKKVCIFCNGSHLSVDCFVARKMSFKEKQNILKEKKCCFLCLSNFHISKSCKAVLKCFLCGRKHSTVMCQMLDKQNNANNSKEEIKVSETDVNLANFNKNQKVFLQTLKVKILSNRKEKVVRAILDTGSSKSYIVKSLAKEMSYIPLHREKTIHALFGGVSSQECDHNVYKIRISNLKGSFKCNFDVLDQNIICDSVMPIGKGSWIEELKKENIVLTDISDTVEPIQVLIGADVIGKLLTGRKKQLSSGLVALETSLGWTLMGKVSSDETSENSLALTVNSLFVNEAKISDLWTLDSIGIKDPIERKSKSDLDRQIKERFINTVKFNEEGRYEISLPWIEDEPPLPDNLCLAKKRLSNVTAKLLEKDLYPKYERVLFDWLSDKIIEEVPESEVNSYGNYLPHRPVIKLSSTTTPIRPVFDASARLKNSPSLNDCLYCGPNLIEKIPDLLLRFREGKYGIIADIKKAYLQISIRKQDRDFLRFLWWSNLEQKKFKVFRHTRVVFGCRPSAFLLGSVIEYHIKKDHKYDNDLKNQLLKSFYVDNVVTSVSTEKDLGKFISDSKKLMAEGGFDLRAWEHTEDDEDRNNDISEDTVVLGLRWNKHEDILKIHTSWLKDIDLDKITKRVMLSVAHKIFDPIGFTAPVMIYPKLMIQKTWQLRISWDEEISCDLKQEFIKWFQELHKLSEIEIPRFIQVMPDNLTNCSIHTFCDASQYAYAAVVFLRIELKDRVEIFLLMAKSRLSPLKNATIPRLELLAALIGSRLANTVIEALKWTDMPKFFWSDSTTVLTWIKKEDSWSVFVRNRVKEIRRLTEIRSWKFVPGKSNPSDLPSRGCDAKKLVALKWWEGPHWLRDPKIYSEYIDFIPTEINEEEIISEKLKSSNLLLNADKASDVDWYYRHFSNYGKIVRLVGWIKRFLYNCRKINKRKGELSSQEYRQAELKLTWLIQQESFISAEKYKFKNLEVFKDDQDIIRVKTKIVYREDTEDFIAPIILPSKHEVVKRLVLFHHVRNCHAGPQIMLNILREKYWILNGRRTVTSVVSKCITCKRFNSKNLESEPVHLPRNRIKDAAIFEIIGIDMAGPLLLKDGKKSWVIVFTCAIYRAVHLELVTSASTEAFLMALRRFVSRRGRCSIIYCDNGSNFVGANNVLKKLDWVRIQESGTIDAIQWRFNPPAAPWWGGWWERIIRLIKELLRRVLGRACLDYEEMVTVLVDCESIINSRPITYIPQNEAIKPISPDMFLKDIRVSDLTDVNIVEECSMNKRLKYRQKLQNDLRNRFRSEYLGQLMQRPLDKYKKKQISVGDIVLVGADNKKRLDWSLGRIIELLPSKDKKIRTVKLKTAYYDIIRPIQRIYPLEISSCENEDIVSKIESKDESIDEMINTTKEQSRSRSGRLLKMPERLML